MFVPPRLAVIILTFNEELNLGYALQSIQGLADQIFIVDSFSTDKTVEIAKSYGAHVVLREFKNYSDQRRFALESLAVECEWILVLDADETLTQKLKIEIKKTIQDTPYDAFRIKRKFFWRGKWIRWGYYPVWLLRLGRTGLITCDHRPVNEHLVCKTNKVGNLNNDFIDENRKGVSFWVEKHNQYSTAECLLAKDKTSNFKIKWFLAGPVERKKIIRFFLWDKMPLIFRSFLYFFYRYFIRLGFLDGVRGLEYHLLHAFFYRALIDIKINESTDSDD